MNNILSIYQFFWGLWLVYWSKKFKVMEILESKEFKNAWSQVNYGKNSTPKSILSKITLKVGLGYHVGSGSNFLLTEIGFIDEGKLTSKGIDFLFELIETNN